MALISVNDLTFYYDGSSDNIFDDVSFQLDTDWKLGFIARNGRGKTTFLNLLMGKYEYIGNISTPEPFDYFPFKIEDMSVNTVDVLEQVDPDYEFWKVCRELSLLQVSEDVLFRPFSTLSNGEQTKVGLALLFSKDNHFLLLDEPTNHLDMPTRELLRDYLKTKKGFILVSHDRDLLDACIDHVLVINKTNIEVYQGNFSTWWENKQRQDAFELAENERLSKDIKRLKQAARQTANWADKVESTKIGAKSFKYEKNIDTRAYVGEKSRRMQSRRKNLERREQNEIKEKEGLLKNIERAEDLKLFPLRHYKPVLVNMKDIQISYGSSEFTGNTEFPVVASTEIGRKILSPVSLAIENGDRVVLSGKNGCGKSSAIKLLLQELQRNYTDAIIPSPGASAATDILNPAKLINFSGAITLASGLKVSYVSQETNFLQGSLMDYAKSRNLNETVFLGILRRLDFSREQFEKKMQDYSGGQKKKVLLAASLSEQAHLYIWDEPLNFIDIFSRMQLEDLIMKFKPTMLLVEHDRTFVEKVANKVVTFR